ncbi:MAG: glycosyltransferase [Bacteroidales bacterium]|nr:glycosyltransferase [Bacteroidales bacterium]
MAKRIIVSVINDLATDQRVKKVCGTLSEMGFEILLIGRRLKKSPEMDMRPYLVKRMKLVFTKGPLFYLEYQIRLFVLLLFLKADVLLSNDLDTLLPNYLISKMKDRPLIYDSHEYFTGVPELENHPLKRSIWKRIEKSIFPHLKHVFTVSDSIAKLYESGYRVLPQVVRNVPLKRDLAMTTDRKSLGLPEDKKIIILQGSGINVHRGAEELVEAMQFVPDDMLLLIVGDGDVIDILKQKAHDLKLDEKVVFKPRVPYDILMKYTAVADLGVTLDKDNNINYRYSLPNKVFDYIQVGIPVLSSELVEIKKLIEKYQVGTFIPCHDPKQIAMKLVEIFNNTEQLGTWRNNTKTAREELNWEKESEILKKVFQEYV